MKGMIRLVGAIAAIVFLNAAVAPFCVAQDLAGQAERKVTTNDPLFVPLTEQKSLETKKKVKWYWYALGVVALGAVVALAAGGGGGGGGSSGTATGTVTGTW